MTIYWIQQFSSGWCPQLASCLQCDCTSLLTQITHSFLWLLLHYTAEQWQTVSRWLMQLTRTVPDYVQWTLHWWCIVMAIDMAGIVCESDCTCESDCHWWYGIYRRQDFAKALTPVLKIFTDHLRMLCNHNNDVLPSLVNVVYVFPPCQTTMASKTRTWHRVCRAV